MLTATPIEQVIATDRERADRSLLARAASGSSGVARKAQEERKRLTHAQPAAEVQGTGL